MTFKTITVLFSTFFPLFFPPSPQLLINLFSGTIKSDFFLFTLFTSQSVNKLKMKDYRTIFLGYTKFFFFSASSSSFFVLLFLSWSPPPFSSSSLCCLFSPLSGLLYETIAVLVSDNSDNDDSFWEFRCNFFFFFWPSLTVLLFWY